MMLNYETYWNDNQSHPYHPSVRMRNKFILDTLCSLSPKSILDCWCGDWYLVSVLKDKYWTADVTMHGIDYSKAVTDINKVKRPDIDFSYWDLWLPLLSARTYDVVICSEVIEHIVDRHQVVWNLSKLISSWWYIILSTQSGKRYESDLVNGHVKHFSLQELEDDFAQYNVQTIFSYKKWFPWYDLQKMVHSNLIWTAKSIQYGEMTVWKKALFTFVYRLFLFTPKSKTLWTQIYMLLQKK